MQSSLKAWETVFKQNLTNPKKCFQHNPFFFCNRESRQEYRHPYLLIFLPITNRSQENQALLV